MLKKPHVSKIRLPHIDLEPRKSEMRIFWVTRVSGTNTSAISFKEDVERMIINKWENSKISATFVGIGSEMSLRIFRETNQRR